MTLPLCRRSAAVLSLWGAIALAGRAEANPNLVVGTWVDITPPTVKKGAPETCIGQGVQFDPSHPSTIYWGTTPYTTEAGGLFKSTDAGSNWDRVAKVTAAFQGASDHLDMPLHMRIDPGDPNHMYAGDGVRGGSQGFFVSTDGGVTFIKPKSFVDTLTAAGIDNQDIYDVAADPSDFKHVLITWHYRWGWTDTKWNTNSGVLESKDGGTTWIVHEPGQWGSGHAIKFLYNPALGIGDSHTWLLGTQGAGYWRTTDSGTTWKQVSTTNITHGGAAIYYTAAGVLYAPGERSMRSTDNGATWSDTGLSTAWCVYGDGKTLYTGKSFGANQSFSVSPETDGATWKDFNTQKFVDGPYEMAYDSTNGILYSSNWTSGLWALKVGDGTGVLPGDGGASTGGDAGKGGAGTGTGGAGPAGNGSGGGSAGAGVVTGESGAGPGGASSQGGSGSSVNDMAATTPSTASTNDPGCACRAGRAPRDARAPWGAVLLAGLLLVRRRHVIAAGRSSPLAGRRS